MVSSHFAPLELVKVLSEAGVPVVETVQNTYAWFTDVDWRAEVERLESVAGVVAVSEMAGEYYRRFTGHRPEWVVPNAVHPGRAARVPRDFARRVLGLEGAGPVFAFVGRVTEQKNPAGLVRAFAQAFPSSREAVLLLAGPADGSAPVRALRRRHRELFGRGAIRHVASLRHVGTILSAADAFVSNGFYEGWSVAASEAAWCGLPLVLSETGGSAALIGADGARGRLVPNPCGDPLSVDLSAVGAPPAGPLRANEEALGAALVDVTEGRPGWRERSEEIRGWARRELAPGVIARRYADILAAVAAVR